MVKVVKHNFARAMVGQWEKGDESCKHGNPYLIFPIWAKYPQESRWKA